MRFSIVLDRYFRKNMTFIRYYKENSALLAEFKSAYTIDDNDQNPTWQKVKFRIPKLHPDMVECA
jgi:hypothetical protein